MRDDDRSIYRYVGMIARWQPMHLGHAAVLRAICNRAEFGLIGIGRANEHHLRAPFSVYGSVKRHLEAGAYSRSPDAEAVIFACKSATCCSSSSIRSSSDRE